MSSHLLKILQPYVIIVVSDNELKEDLLQVLAGEGCLVGGFSDHREALRFLKSTFILPRIIVAEEKLDTEGLSFFEELNKDKKLGDIPLIQIKHPNNMRSIVNSIESLIAPVC